MNHTEIMSNPPRVLSQDERAFFFDRGYVVKECMIGSYCLDKLNTAMELTGPAATIAVHHCATLYASQANLSKLGRPVLIINYCACDAVGCTAVTYPASNCLKAVRDEETKFSWLEPMNMCMPPDWSDGYTSIFEHQEEA